MGSKLILRVSTLIGRKSFGRFRSKASNAETRQKPGLSHRGKRRSTHKRALRCVVPLAYIFKRWPKIRDPFSYPHERFLRSIEGLIEAGPLCPLQCGGALGARGGIRLEPGLVNALREFSISKMNRRIRIKRGGGVGLFRVR
jgi:hypothetical protein